MAAGDIVSVSVLATGWEADITLSGLAVGGTYAFGLGTNNDPDTGTPKITFTVVSLGYDATGAATTISRTVYGTHEVRWPYSTASILGAFTAGTFTDGETVTASVSGRTAIVLGAQSAGTKLYVRTVSGATNAADVWTGGTSGAIFTASATHSTLTSGAPRERNDGTNTTVRIALSEYVYQKDNTGGGNSGTAPTVTLLSGVYTSGGTPSAAATNAAVTNSSTAAYPKVVGNWSRPPFQRVTGNFSLGCVAFHSSGQNGAPVACVVFSAADTHSHTATTTVTAHTIDGTYGDAVPVVEYLGTIAVSTLTALDVLTCNFIAYPWIGDSTSVLDTSAGTAAPTPLYGPITMLNDKSNTYGVTVAIVDSVSGNDSGGSIGVAVDIASFVEGSTSPFLTIGKAAAAIAAYNNSNHSRATVGGGIIYLKTGTHAWLGSANSYGTAPSDWLTITRAPSATRAGVILDGNNNDDDISGRILILDVTIHGLQNLYFNAISTLWMDQCTIDQTGISNTAFVLVFGTSRVWLTRSTVTLLYQGLRPSGTQNTPLCLCRGNTIGDFATTNSTIVIYTFIGNLRTGIPAAAASTLITWNYSASLGRITSVSAVGRCLVS